MAKIIYTVRDNNVESIAGVEQYQDQDINLVTPFEINSTFIPTKHSAELHILSLSDDLLYSEYDYKNYRVSENIQSAEEEGVSAIIVDPVQDVKFYGYNVGGVKVLYHFLNNLYKIDDSPVEFFIENISPDRTEVRLTSLNLSSEDILATTSKIIKNSQNRSYQDEFRLNFKNNDLLIVINIATVQVGSDTMIAIKLYEPLPIQYALKSTLGIVEIVSNSISYDISIQVTETETVQPSLRTPNFDIEVEEESVISSGYFSYDDLLSFPTTNTANQVLSTINEKSIDISIDYSDFNNFIQFSSAQERLLNFKYKVDLINNYTLQRDRVNNPGATSTLAGGRVSYDALIKGVVSNFDHYERYLYYESGNNSWPKVNTSKPYILNSVDLTWYQDKLIEAVAFDDTNNTSLVNTIPAYLKEDKNNENYLTFVYMIGQHFDNLWVYSQAVTDKYNADNRLHMGISKDLVAEALKNFGVKLYTSNKSIEDLFTTIVGQAYQPGNEQINTYIAASDIDGTAIEPTSLDNYQKEIYKRIYHNLPLLLKSKGTERGLRTLINCFGISSDILSVKLYGGRDVTKKVSLGDTEYYTSSLDRIRLDNTGSIITGNTLSNYTTIVEREVRYTDDLHILELGFSPTDAVDKYIISSGGPAIAANTLTKDFSARVSSETATVESLPLVEDTVKGLGFKNSTFVLSIDQLVGDPRSLNTDNYSGLDEWNRVVTHTLSRYDVKDFIRLIKFFDNTIFKMVKDFIPARAVANTGIVIKPHVLNRSKARSTKASVDTIGTSESTSMNSAFHYTSSMQTNSTVSSDGGSFGSRNQVLTSPGFVANNTPQGRFIKQNLVEGAKYTGEFTKSIMKVSTGELNTRNQYKNRTPIGLTFNINFYNNSTSPDDICTLFQPAPTVIRPGIEYNLVEYFVPKGSLPPKGLRFYNNTTNVEIPSKYTFNLSQYNTIDIKASSTLSTCFKVGRFMRVKQDLAIKQETLTTIVSPSISYNLNDFFSLGENTDITYTLRLNSNTVGIVQPTAVTSPAFTFTPAQNDSIYEITATDKNDSSIKAIKFLSFEICPLGPIPGAEIFKTKVITEALTDAVSINNFKKYFTNTHPGSTYSFRQSATSSFSASNAEIPFTTSTTTVAPNNIHFTSASRHLQIKCVNFTTLTGITSTPCTKIIQIDKEIGTKAYKTIPGVYYSTTLKQACNLGDVQGTGQIPDIGEFTYEDTATALPLPIPQVLNTYKPLFLKKKQWVPQGVSKIPTTDSNLLNFSEQFENEYWTKNSCTIVPNLITAPDGTITADKIVSNSITARISVSRVFTITANTRNTFSLYAKAAEWSRICIFHDSANISEGGFKGNGVIVDLLTGISTSPSTTTVTSVGNGWYRIETFATYLTTAHSVAVVPFNPGNANVNAVVGDGVSGIYIWGAQFEVGSVATAYNPVRIASSSISNISHSININTNSENFINTGYNIYSGSLTANTVLTPLNTTSSVFIKRQQAVKDTTDIINPENANSYVYKDIPNTLTRVSDPLFPKTFTLSIFVKQGTIPGNFGLRISGNYPNRGDALFNLTTGTLIGTANGGTNTGTTATITPADNGWYRCSITTTLVTNTTGAMNIFWSPTALTNPAVFEGADGALSECYVWGAQLEYGSEMSAYIPTTTQAKNGEFIKVTTLQNHGFETGDRVYITGVKGTTNANGNWRTVKTGLRTIELQKSLYNAAYVPGSGGNVVLSTYNDKELFTGAIVDNEKVYAVQDGTLLYTLENCNQYNNIS
jgi:hypothetical protein